MRPRRTHLLALAALLALASAALYSACFKPELGIESFRCNEDGRECPEGYVCHRLTPDDWRCFQEGHEPPPPKIDMGPPKEGGPPVDGPPVDGPPALNCTGPHSIIGGHGQAKLLVTEQNTPVLLFIDTNENLVQRNLISSKWETRDPQIDKVKTFDATIDGEGKLHIAYLKQTDTKTLRHCFKGTDDAPCAMDKVLSPIILGITNTVESLAVASWGGSIAAAVGIRNKQGKTRGLLLRVKPTDATGTDYTYSLICEQVTDLVTEPSMIRASLALNDKLFAVSYYIDSGTATSVAKVWTYPANVTPTSCKINSNFEKTNLPTQGNERRLLVAADADDVNAAHGNQINPKPGRVYHYTWPVGGAPKLLNASPADEAWSASSCEPESIDLAMSGKVPMISLIENAGPRRLALRFKGKNGWDDIPLPTMPNTKVGSHTSLAINAATGTIHIGFEGEDTSSSNTGLFVISCSGVLPK